MRDGRSGAGGINHLLLPGEEECGSDGHAMRHGVHAMELLVNGLLQNGARREYLKAKLFGGARLLEGLTDIGSRDASLAETFLQRERIAFTGCSLRGVRARRVQFWPISGRAGQMVIECGEPTVFAAERRATSAQPGSGSVEML